MVYFTKDGRNVSDFPDERSALEWLAEQQGVEISYCEENNGCDMVKCNDCKWCGVLSSTTDDNGKIKIDFLCRKDDSVVKKTMYITENEYFYGNEQACILPITECPMYAYNGVDDNGLTVKEETCPGPSKEKQDNVNHPSHYTWLKEKCGIEVIDITRHLDFCTGNAIKYLLRAGHKEDADKSKIEKEIEDFKKAEWYVKDRIEQLEKEKNNKKLL